MEYRVFVIPFHEQTMSFADEVFRSFCQQNRIVDCTPHFYIHDSVPTWTVMVGHRGPQMTKPKRPMQEPSNRKKSSSVKASMTKVEEQRYELLRTWRNKQSIKEGRPPYAIFTNAQVADIAKQNPETIAGLKRIDGIGDGLSNKYGKMILELCKGEPES